MLSALRGCGLWLAIFALSLLFILSATVAALFGAIAGVGLWGTEWSRSSIRAARRTIG